MCLKNESNESSNESNHYTSFYKIFLRNDIFKLKNIKIHIFFKMYTIF